MSSDLVEQLRALRVKAGLSQEELARRARVSVRAVRDIEQGRVRQPRPDSIERLTAALAAATGTAGPVAEPLSTPAFEIAVLGPVTVTVAAVPLHLGSVRQRVLLAVLALQPNQAVSRAELIDALWNEDPPETSVGLVHTYVARLRKALGPVGEPLIVRSSGGYLLRAGPEQVDAARFAHLVGRAASSLARGAADTAFEDVRHALALWRGPVVSDLDSRLRQHPVAVALNQRRVNAALQLADTGAALGRHDETLDELHAVAVHAPFHEGLHARLMVALAAAGQQEAALRLFADLRDRLAGQLGVEPGPELRDAHLRVLRQDLSIRRPITVAGSRPRHGAPAAPAQLPADVAAFTGRHTALAQLDAAYAPDGQPPTRTTIAVISGMAGAGKSALAVHWSHRNRHRFPDGQLHINLRGHAGQAPVTALQAIEHLLRSLGTPADEIPGVLSEAAALYRSLLSGRRVLVLLDNAISSEQVRPLIPAGAGTMVLATSRHQLGGLVAVDGARRITVDGLTPGEASELLTLAIPGDRVRADPAAVAALANACAHLPLALRIAAANLADDPTQSIAGYVDGLRQDDRLDALASADGEAAVRAAFDLSYLALDEHDRRLFRRLGLVPGDDFTADAAATLAAIPVPRVTESLRRLAAAHLVHRLAPRRYALHDLIRLYAVERARAEEPAGEPATAVRRLLTWYLDAVHGAAGLLHPGMLRLPNATAAVPHHGGPDAVGQWLDAEYTNILDAIRYAADHGPHELAWRLTDALRPYLWKRATQHTWAEIAEAGLRLAQRAEDPRAEAVMRLNLADLELHHSRYQPAMEHAAELLNLARRSGWLEAEATAHTIRTAMFWRVGRLADASAEGEQGLAIDRRLGLPHGHGSTLGNLVLIYRDLGRLAEAERLCRQALELAGPDQLSRAIRLSNLGQIVHYRGRFEEARRYYDEALAIGHSFTDAEVRLRLAALLRDIGELDQAADFARQGIAAAREKANRQMEALALGTSASIHLARGEALPAAREYDEALRLAERIGERGVVAELLAGLASARLACGAPDAALAAARRALAIAVPAGYRLAEGHARAALAHVHRAWGDTAEAAEQAEAAAAIHHACGYVTRDRQGNFSRPVALAHRPAAGGTATDQSSPG
ncbi:tetratricopeptide repeat protein [Micromonospora sp. CPCC 205371]|nr:tetratricopeptide repeat protein [Micromonospora sp. CPCC 205371]